MHTTVDGISLPPRRLTVEEWGDLPDDVQGELVGGWLVEEEVPSIEHEQVVMWLGALLRPRALARGGTVIGSGAKYATRGDHGRRPDLSVLLPPELPRGRTRVVRSPPAIAVEVITDTPRDVRRDRVENLAEYASFGVRSYWIVDPSLRTFEVFELGSDRRYVHAVGASEGRVEVPGAPGLLDLAALWPELDALPSSPGRE